MRFVLLLLLLSCTGEAQTLLGRQIVLNRQQGTVHLFLNELDSISGISLSYSSGIVELSRKVELNGHEKTVEDFLKSILKGQAVKYLEQNGKIFLVVAQPPPLKKKFTVNGYILDKRTGEKLIGASLYSLTKKIGTTSNNYGFFSITLEEDTIDLQASYAGYTSQSHQVALYADVSLSIELEQNFVSSQVVVVNSEAKKNTQNRTIVGKIDVPVTLMKSIPALLGEPDVIKAMKLLPGVQGGNEGTTGLNIRGGSADQNLLLLDGVPVYNASHAFGLFSIFNADAVHHVELLKGGFPASYGGRVSSILAVHMKEGDKYKFHGEGGIGFIFSKLTLEGPIKKGRSSFLISARRTYMDLLMRPILKWVENSAEVAPFFMDVNAKANFAIRKKDRIYFSLYTGLDQLKVKDEFFPGSPDGGSNRLYSNYLSWGNITAMSRWNHEFNKKTFANFTFNYSRYRFNASQLFKMTQINEYEASQKYFSGIKDLNIKVDIDYLPSHRHFIKVGFSATQHRYRPGINRVFEKDTIIRVNEEIDQHSLYAGEYDIYAEDDIKLTDKMKANVGMRFTGFAVKGKMFLALQPRLNLLYKLNQRWSVKTAAGTMNQYIHLLTNTNMGLPTDLWLPATTRVPPQSAKQASAGLSYTHDKSLEASMEVYYKTLKNVIEYKQEAGFGNTYDNWEDMVEIGTGKTYGTEWLLQKKKGTITGLLGYTLSRSLRQFKNINQGKPFPYKYDRRHEIKILGIWQPSARFECSVNWIFSTGQAISMPSYYYIDPFTGRNYNVYESRNNFRMPDYHRLDVALKLMKQKKGYLRTWIFGIYNVYGQFNPVFRYMVVHRTGERVFEEVAVFSFVPTISYQFKF